MFTVSTLEVDGMATSRQYHHGNLRAALIETAVDLAREGGPDAVVLREATKRVGVSPNAAYRHFADRDAFLEEVCGLGMARLADSIVDALDALGSPSHEPGELARMRLKEVGQAYVRFGLAEPGLFRTAFSVPEHLPYDAAATEFDDPARSPFALLNVVLDELVAAGTLPAERRPGAEITCWSGVHGFTSLCLDGPLRALPDTARDHALEQVLVHIDRGL